MNFAELAGLYFPGCSTKKNAVRSLMRYIHRCKPLALKLEELGFAPYNHRMLSPQQVEYIMYYLGDPYDE